MAETEDLHALDPRSFYEQVHSFEFWFEAVRGYLEDTRYGRRPDTGEPVAAGAERERLITVLCNYCVGETAALEGAGGLIEIAPNRDTKVFLSTQTVDEGRHLEVLVHRLRELGVTDPEDEIARRASPSLQGFRRRLLELVHDRDWAAAIFAQNVVLESMEFTVFQRHARSADPRTRELLQRIVKDERRHIGFGENELGRYLAGSPKVRARLGELRTELDRLVLRCFGETLETIGAPRSDRTELGRNYLDAVGRLGVA
jgi:1,2-phenylacetyl-CoA epoxidase catalytic subunit